VDDLTQRIAKLEAIGEITALKARYGRACDAGHPRAEIEAIFTADAVWADTSGNLGTHEGVEAILEFFAGIGAVTDWSLHLITNPDIDVDDDLERATASWVVLQPCTISGEAIWTAGTFEDEYRRVDDAWKIARTEVTLGAITPYELGWAKQQFAGA
jgi:SnoaL-like protein